MVGGYREELFEFQSIKSALKLRRQRHLAVDARIRKPINYRAQDTDWNNLGGGERNRTDVRDFAGRCHHSVVNSMHEFATAVPPGIHALVFSFDQPHPGFGSAFVERYRVLALMYCTDPIDETVRKVRVTHFE